MSRPFTTKQGFYYLDVKVPLALHPRAKGQRMSLPMGSEHHRIVVGDKVFPSLRTKEAKVAKERFPLTLNALTACFELAQPAASIAEQRMHRRSPASSWISTEVPRGCCPLRSEDPS